MRDITKEGTVVETKVQSDAILEHSVVTEDTHTTTTKSIYINDGCDQLKMGELVLISGEKFFVSSMHRDTYKLIKY